eukprot:scaffold4187_cov57-Phaeocystis_antarctica.AAC.1
MSAAALDRAFSAFAEKQTVRISSVWYGTIIVAAAARFSIKLFLSFGLATGRGAAASSSSPKSKQERSGRRWQGGRPRTLFDRASWPSRRASASPCSRCLTSCSPTRRTCGTSRPAPSSCSSQSRPRLHTPWPHRPRHAKAGDAQARWQDISGGKIFRVPGCRQAVVDEVGPNGG